MLKMLKGCFVITYFVNVLFSSCSCFSALSPFKLLTGSCHYLVEYKSKMHGLPPVFSCTFGNCSWVCAPGVDRGEEGNWVFMCQGAECATLPEAEDSQMLFSPDVIRKFLHEDPLLSSIFFFTHIPCLSACSVSCWCSETTPECSSWCFQSQP